MKTFRALETRFVMLIYGTLVIISLLWDSFSHHNPFWSWTQSHLPNFTSTLLGVMFTGVYLLIVFFISSFFTWTQELEKVFRQILTPLSYVHILVLALLSGFVEEWFFRGILMNHFGIVISSIIFALGHLLPYPHLWLWSIWTFFVGIIFCFLFLFSHSLLFIALIHASINGILLLWLNRKSIEAPALLSSNQ